MLAVLVLREGHMPLGALRACQELVPWAPRPAWWPGSAVLPGSPRSVAVGLPAPLRSFLLPARVPNSRVTGRLPHVLQRECVHPAATAQEAVGFEAPRRILTYLLLRTPGEVLCSAPLSVVQPSGCPRPPSPLLSRQKSEWCSGGWGSLYTSRLGAGTQQSRPQVQAGGLHSWCPMPLGTTAPV